MRCLPGSATGRHAGAIAAIDGFRTLLVMTENTPSAEHIFLSRRGGLARYLWSERTSYRRMAAPGFPRPIGGRYRLDTLIAWEERGLAGLNVPAAAPTAREQSIKRPSQPEPMIPAKKRKAA